MAYTKNVWTDRDVQYPNRYTLTNVSGTTYDVARAEGTVNAAGTLFNAAKMNNIEDGLENVDTRLTTEETNVDNLQIGWLPAGETWTYASVDDPTGNITISGNVTTKYSVGMRIKFTNGGNVIYGIITKLAYSSPNTTMTFLHEIDPADSLAKTLMANSAITLNYYSTMKTPYGFPIEQSKWTVLFTNTNLVSQATPTINTWYNLGTQSLSVPIGTWKIGWDAVLNVSTQTTTTIGEIYGTLSTANNSESEKRLTGFYSFRGASTTDLRLYLTVTKSIPITVASKTTYYLNAKTTQTANTIYFRGDVSTTSIYAVCDYL